MNMNMNMNMRQEDEEDDEPSVSTSTRFIRLNPRYDANQTLKLLRKEFKNGEEAIEVPWLSKDLGFYAIPESFALSRSETFHSGRIYGMCVSSGAAVAALLLEEYDVNKSRGEEFSGEEEKDDSSRTCINGEYELRVLDLCCAPGLKTCAIADLLETTHGGKANIHIVGVDVSEKRLQLCKNIIKKYHVDHETCGGGAEMPSITNNNTVEVEVSHDGNNKIESPNAMGCLPNQKIIIQLFNADGTKFGTSRDSSSLIFDSRVAMEQKNRAGKRKRMNKSAKARESKRLKMVADDFFTNVNCSGVNNVSNVANDSIEGGEKSESEKSPSITIPLFDRVLVDAECSTDGAVRHLQHKYRSTRSQEQMATNSKLTNAQQLQDLVALQKKLIMAGFGLLKPGGIMVYSTCSLAKEQNEDVVSWFLSECRESAELVPVSFEGSAVNTVYTGTRTCGDPISFPPKQRDLEAITDGKIMGTVRFHPSVNNDLFGGGFFLAKITKK
mmetsp:Transcript_17410/g.26016  ORF Transcript_17410/g.26016 Transcript_17410/m.26016 type:complete len:498 (+) Transcript_17410:2-1495(+)